MAQVMQSGVSVFALSTLILVVILLQAFGGWVFARAIIARERARASQQSSTDRKEFLRTRAWLRSGFLYAYLALIFGGALGAPELVGWCALWLLVICSLPLCCIGAAWHFRLLRHPAARGEDRVFHGGCLALWLVGLVGTLLLLTSIATPATPTHANSFAPGLPNGSCGPGLRFVF